MNDKTKEQLVRVCFDLIEIMDLFEERKKYQPVRVTPPATSSTIGREGRRTIRDTEFPVL
jgi:hypothetical protein